MICLFVLLRLVRIPPFLLLLLSDFGFLGGRLAASTHRTAGIGLDGLGRRALIGVDLP